MEEQKVALGVIGLGLIGGSAALSLRERGFCNTIYGYEINKNHGVEAQFHNIVDELLDLDGVIERSNVIILAVPVNVAREQLIKILDKVAPTTTVLDFGSTKKGICEAVANHKNRAQYVACHPIAGTENSGPEAAFPELYDGKVNIICDGELSSKEAMVVAKRLFETMNMKIKFMDSIEHDRHIAYVSHLSHISAFTLGQTVLEVEKDEKNIFNMAGSGFASTVRLAKSAPSMWAPIFEQNSDNLSEVLGAYIKNLQEFKVLIDNGDTDKLYALMSKVNDIRRILDGNKLTQKEL